MIIVVKYSQMDIMNGKLMIGTPYKMMNLVKNLKLEICDGKLFILRNKNNN